MDIKDKTKALIDSLPSHVTLVAVSKTKSVEKSVKLTRLVSVFLVKIKSKKWPPNGKNSQKTLHGI
jgi:hypothetical protein